MGISKVICALSSFLSSSCKVEGLAVCDWSERLSFYHLTGKQVLQPGGSLMNRLTITQKSVKGPVGTKCGKDRYLGFVPMCMNWIGDSSEYLAICGQNRKINLYSYEGCQLGALSEENSWILSSARHPREKSLIQLSDRILIYESAIDDTLDMHYRIQEKVMLKFNCQLLVLTSRHIVYCQGRRITCINSQGEIEQEWRVGSPVQYIHQQGSLEEDEGLIIGMMDGQITKVTLSSLFAVPLINISTKISCVGVSADCDKIAIIDGSSTLTIRSLTTHEIHMRETGAQGFAWNQINNNLLCYCSNDTLYVVVDDYVCHQQPLEGVVINFYGASVYCISKQTVRCVEVQLAQAMYYYLNAGRLQEAYRIACLGVAECDWRELGKVALLSMEFQIAQSAFIQLGDYFHLTYIQQLSERQRCGAVQEPDSELVLADTLLIEAELACYQGNYNEAVKAFKKANHPDRILCLYMDLRRFSEAKEAMVLAAGDNRTHFAQQARDTTRFLLTKHAEWARTTKDHRAAAIMFTEAGDFAAAAELAAEHGWVDVLLEISRKIDKGDRISLDLCAKKLVHLGEYAFAADCYARMGDIGSQVDILIKAGKWEELLSLVQEHPEFTRRVYLPYAQWLAVNDSFEEAQAAFAQAGLAKEAVKFLEELANCAVFESRFDDASSYYWKLSRQCAEVAKNTNDVRTKRNNLRRFQEFSKLADLYYVYSNIHQYMNDSFASHMPETYFNMARYLLNRVGKDEIKGISKVYILCTLAKNSWALRAFKMARCAFDRLQTLHIKEPLRQMVELQSLAIRATPPQDSEDVTIVCYRCSTTVSTLQNENRCSNCKAPFIYSFLSFDVLPLVEFVPDPELTEEEVTECIRSDSAAHRKAPPGGPSCEDKALGIERDAFTEKVVSFNLGSDQYRPVVLDAETLRTIPSSEIIILEPGYPIRKQFFKNVLPEIGITFCKSCNKLFQKEDYQVLLLQKQQCPFCRCRSDD
ncbi:hypothetical protein TcWFU_002419 [Taenia crassiceps]|uniref:Intraflagellar transport protein 122 homolog n=1 Tax=Taenia crassiceps TaxID=6207 RepID=A0ABR4QP36_9CEST